MTPGQMRGLQVRVAKAAARREDYFDLTRNLGVGRAEAARRLGVCERTVRRYEARLRAEVSR